VPTRETLFDLFGDFSAAWPVRLVQETPGLPSQGAAPSPAVWLTALNGGVRVTHVRAGAVAGGRVSVEAELRLDSIPAYSGGWPFVLTSMPDVEFRVQPVSAADAFVQLFASVGDDGVEVVLERLPVEILLPLGLVEPHPTPDDHPSGIAEIPIGSFTPGRLDDLKVVLRRDNPTSIFVHLRMHVTPDGQFDIQPAVPISFGKCVLAAVPCLAVHDFRLIPSPRRVPDRYEWVRHSVEPWLESSAGIMDGLFAARTIHVDPDAEPLKDAAKWLNSHSTDKHPAAELVVDDVVMPFWAPYVVPVPRHVTTGIRRRILDPNDIAEVFAFERAPIHVHLSRDPAVALIVESLFYKSQPSEDLDEDLGLTFRAALVFGEDTSPQHAFELGVGENYTLTLGYRRDFSTTEGLPAPGTGTEQAINRILHWEIAGSLFVDVLALRAGFSFGRKFGEEASFANSTEATVDAFVSMPPTGSDDSFFRLRALNGEKVAFAIEGIGWRQGSFHVEGVEMPDGVVAFFGPVGLIIHEIGLAAEQGASYLSFSAGVMVKIPSGFEGGMSVRRLRFRVAGDETQPPFKLDGFFLLLRGPAVKIEAGGYYTEQLVDQTRVREFGLTGTVGFELGVRAYLFGVDLISGNRSSPTEEFDYFMVQAFFQGSIPIALVELRSARVLFADNMLPRLAPVDRDSRDLRYFNWYRSSNPLTVPGDRRLASWRAEKDAFAFGIGAGASITGLGKGLEIALFVLVLDGPSEGGFLIVGEVLLLSNPRAVGYFALEWDGKNDRFSLVIGVELKIDNFLKNPPSWSTNIAKLTGTLYIGNDPGTFAIGRLADQRTWLSLLFDIDLWFVRSFIQIGACIEVVDRPEGPKGFGVVARIEGGISAGVVRVTYNAGFGFLAMTFNTGSSDYAAAIWIEAGLRIVLFGFLRFGIGAKAELRTVGSSPARTEMKLQVRLETPWFMPDVTWTLEVVFGELAPADLATAVSPLRTAAVTDGSAKKRLPAHVERFDAAWNGEGVTTTHSVNALRTPGTAEATRIQSFEDDTSVRPVATDATVALEWSVPVNDKLGLGGGVMPNLGDQRSGDLTMSYDLVGIAVRRRSRFGPDRSWHPLEEKLQLTANFSDPNGVSLNGSFAPQELTKFWDLDVQAGGGPATKKLLLNGSAPFEFTTSNPEVDEDLIKGNPSWPCCERDRLRVHRKLHEVDFRDEHAGVALTAPRLFSRSQSRLRFLRDAWVRPALAGGLPPGTLVATAAARSAGPIFRCELDEDAAFCWVRLAWSRGSYRLVLVAFDGLGAVVGTQELPPGSGTFQRITVPAQGPIRRLELRVVLAKADALSQLAATRAAAVGTRAVVEVDWAAYVGLRDYLDVLTEDERCGAAAGGAADGFDGRGKLFFLPNHDYEVAVTTRVTVAHPSKPAESADVAEYVYFRTKGLPGLNAVPRTGEELERYVCSAYAGGRGVLYREEPVTLAFQEGFSVAIPLALRPPGATAEKTTLLRMQLLARPDSARESDTVVTATAPDWIVANRGAGIPPSVRPWRPVVAAASTRGSAMVSVDPIKGRLATLTQRPQVDCGIEDPRRVYGTVLVAPPQGEPDPAQPGRELWPASTRWTATVRQEGAGFVDRRPFVDGDETAFSRALDGGQGEASAWTVVDGELRVAPGGRRYGIFGEPTWNHVTVHVALARGAAAAGVGVALPAGTNPSRGLFALVEEGAGGLRIAIYRRVGGGPLTEVAAAPLTAPADPAAPLALTVTAFDDRLRASVGETAVEADRDDLREGRLGLVAQGAAAFRSLHVTGLDMFSFPFATSRFRSFEDHVHSFRGTVDEIAPDALGPGTTTGTVDGLWSATQADVPTVMRPDADPAARQALFERWVRELGLPLTDDVIALELGRFVVGGQTRLLLLESPEALDFTEEVRTTLSRRVWVPGGFGGLDLGDLVTDLGPVATSARKEVDLVDRLEVQGLALEGATTARGEGGVRDVVPRADGLRIELADEAPGTTLPPGSEVVVAEVVGEGEARAARFLAGTVERGRGGARVVHASRTQVAPLAGPAASGLGNVVTRLEPGDLVFIRPGAGLIDLWRPGHWEDQVVDVRVLQDGPGRRALVIPVAGGAATGLVPETYRLELALDRQRWETTEPIDDVNRYRGSATLSLAL
jgi:hypothetical protein